MLRWMAGGAFLMHLVVAQAAVPSGGWKDLPLSTLYLSSATQSTVLVRIRRGVRQISLSGYDLKWKEGRHYKAVGVNGVRWKVALKSFGKSPLWQIETSLSHRERFVGEKMQISAKSLFLDQKSVPSDLQLLARGDGSFDVVAAIQIDEYLKGVLPNEMPALWPMEALKAQAVVARTYALFQMKRRSQLGFHLENTVMDQVFRFRKPLSGLLRGSDRVHKAIEETKGYVLLDKKGNFLPAYYHADCGGRTEEPLYVWGNGLRLGTVKDEACPLSPHGRWQKIVTAKNLQQRFPLKDPKDQWQDMKVHSRTESGRIRRVEFVSKNGESKLVGGNRFRKEIGFGRIKSTFFYIEKQERDWKVFGKGHGHGVGLCQYGARFLAGRGLSFQKILRHYYPKGRLQWQVQDTGLFASEEFEQKKKRRVAF